MAYTMLDHIKNKYPGSMRETSWEEDYQYRIRTGGTNRAATLYANGRHPEDQRELPKVEFRPGAP